MKRVRAWLKSHPSLGKKNNIYAVTSSYELAIANEFQHENIVLFDENIGGRFSIWSPSNILSAILFGSTFFNKFLRGGHSIDKHVYKSLEKSIPFNLSKISFFLELTMIFFHIALYLTLII